MLLFSTYYHIYNHANGDDNLFREEKNYDFFLRKYHQHIDPIAETLAWCLMKNHFHLLIKIKSDEALLQTFPKFETLERLRKDDSRSNLLSKQFSNFFSSYSQAFNKMYQRRGSLFIKNFKRKEIDKEKYLQHAILYIHLNPVKHGFVRHPGDWNQSSFFTFPEVNQKLTKWLFGSTKDYFQLHQDRNNYFINQRNIEDDLT